jgi:1,2-diacylglycerol 3-alpha-glucosyltransferase
VRAHYLENRVVFTGMICHEKVHRYYQAGDLFVSASVSETQGLTYGEALASGLPLLCRKDDCLKGVVEEGVNGWQYENDNEFFDCLEKWEKMKKSRKEKMCKMARESAHQFSAENFGREVEKVYEMGLENFFPGRSGNMYRSGNMGI